MGHQFPMGKLDAVLELDWNKGHFHIYSYYVSTTEQAACYALVPVRVTLDHLIGGSKLVGDL